MRRKRIAPSLPAASAGVALLLSGAEARAQQYDLNPPLPNVLLMVDNSGSMERMTDGTLPEDNTLNACDVSNCVIMGGSPPQTQCTWATRPANAPPLAPNRWNAVLQALSGTPVNGYHCVSMPRSTGSTFSTEYQIDGTPPYDLNYYLPFHRAVGQDTTGGATTPCVFAPGALPGQPVGAGVGPTPGSGAGGNATDFPANAIITRPYLQTNVTSSSCSFGLNSDGVIDTYQDLMRFALMTFDQDPSAATGVTSGASPQVLNPGTYTGMWSYFPGWDGSASPTPASGSPQGCNTPLPFELGARNPAAPPWEGRMVFFPSDETQATRHSTASEIQTVLDATRPYGGTPLAAMFDDAKTYFWTDGKGPSTDPLVQCRQQFIILLTDGAPNEDMRPNCGTQDNPSAPCPYNHADFTAKALAAGGGLNQPSVMTFVIGFAVSSASDSSGPLDCKTLDPAGSDCSAAAPGSALAQCCELDKIAVAGNTGHAYFAGNSGDLQLALNAILAQIASKITTRTTPASSAVSTNVFYTTGTSKINQTVYYSFFFPTPPPPAGAPPPPMTAPTLSTLGRPWSGDVQRQRYDCSQSPPAQTVSPSQGDSFAQDLATNNPARSFMAYLPAGSTPDPTATIRPFASATTPDGLGAYSATVHAGGGSTVVGALTPAAVNPAVPSGTHACQYTSTQNLGPQWLTDAQCKDMVLDFTFGQSFSGPADFAYTYRNGSCAVGDAKPCPFGGVFHATPVDVGPPGSLLHDDSYDAFRATGAATREEMVYVATTDGLLHAFGQPGTTVANNERWAMLLPAVMPNLLSSYPAADKFLLDGRPVVKDVVWDRTQGTVGGGTAWHTTLVASFGPQQLGYYAIDVTNPSFQSVPSTEPSPTGPVFLWQVTKMPATNQALFGPGGATPAITTVFANVDNTVPHEIGVAILPGGGLLSAPTTPAGNAAGCTRDIVQRNLGSAGEATVPSSASPSYKYRTAVRCWGATGAYADPVAGRSVSVVRLDTGEVLRTFMRKADTAALPNDTLLTATPSRILDTPLDSPMTGTPAVYPSDVGADATKFFIADQDGTIWKFDLTDTNPSNWTGKLFLDLYNQTADTNAAATSWNDGEPVSVPLVTSLDPAGEVVVHAATGTLDQFDTSGLNYVYSITEKVQTQSSVASLRASVNWFMNSQSGSLPYAMDQGERVAGPMTVFDGTLFFMTFDASSNSGSSCSPGWAHLYGRDYVTPISASGAPYKGGVNHLSATQFPNAATNGWARADELTQGAPGNTQMSPQNLQGKVIPGVAVQQTTACVTAGAATSDLYVPGAMHAPATSMTPGTYSLVAQVGTGNSTNGGSVETVQVPLPTPMEPTVINSWAAVTE
jgi:type IV pilus assembly protein PilY1